MKIFAPDYYCDFRCSAGNCRHSCCIGWEIDIDSETADFYKNVPGDFGKRLKDNIDFSEEGGVFRLCENERCPFLNEKGLCDIIINLGESALGQICDDHPRFRNFYESRTEIGLGLCCEEVVKLILEKETKTEIIEIDEDEEPVSDFNEDDFFDLRKKVFDALQNREKEIPEKISDAFGIFGEKPSEMDFSFWAKNFLELERLDENWTEVLENIKSVSAPIKIENGIAAEQLLCYFVFRHFSIDYPFDSLCFAVLCFYMTEKAAESVGLFEAARLFSSEIEYSDENKDLILDTIFSENEVLL